MLGLEKGADAHDELDSVAVLGAQEVLVALEASREVRAYLNLVPNQEVWFRAILLEKGTGTITQPAALAALVRLVLIGLLVLFVIL